MFYCLQLITKIFCQKVYPMKTLMSITFCILHKIKNATGLVMMRVLRLRLHFWLFNNGHEHNLHFYRTDIISLDSLLISCYNKL